MAEYASQLQYLPSGMVQRSLLCPEIYFLFNAFNTELSGSS